VQVDHVAGELVLDRAQLRAPLRGAPRPCVDLLHGLAVGPRLVRDDKVERRILAQDRLLQPAQLRHRLQPELLHQRPARIPERVQRIRLPARTVQRQHQQAAQAFAQRMLVHEGPESPDDLRVAARPQLALEAQLDRGQVELPQPASLERGKRLLEHARERLPLPQGQRLPRQLAPGPVAVFGRSFDEPLKAQRVDRHRIDAQLVPAAARHDLRTLVGHQPTQMRNVLLDHLRGGRRRLLAPQAVDKPLDRHGRVGVEREHRQHRSLLRTAQLDRTAVQLDVD
jgi:hypothetical protein